MNQKGNIKDAWEFVNKEMNSVYNMVDGAPFVNLPNMSLEYGMSRLNSFKLIARDFAPSKVQTIKELEKIVLLNYKGKLSDRAAFFKIKPLAIKCGLDPGLIQRMEHKITAPKFKSKVIPQGFSFENKNLNSLNIPKQAFKPNKGALFGLFKPPKQGHSRKTNPALGFKNPALRGRR